jgi:hypothetical protein
VPSLPHGFDASGSIFSTRAASTAPGTRAPLAKIRVGVPEMRALLPNSMLRACADVSQVAAGGAMSLIIQSRKAVPLSFAHQMDLDFSAESCPRIGYRKT